MFPSNEDFKCFSTTENLNRIWYGPKWRDAEKIRAAGIPTPHIYSFPEAIEAMSTGKTLLARSDNEDAQQKSHSEASGLYTTFFLSQNSSGTSLNDMYADQEWQEAFATGNETAIHDYLSRFQSQYQDPEMYAALCGRRHSLPPLQYSWWEYAQGTNLSLVVDPVNPNRFHLSLQDEHGNYHPYIISSTNNDIHIENLTDYPLPDRLLTEYDQLIQMYRRANKVLGGKSLKLMEFQHTPDGFLWLQSLPCGNPQRPCRIKKVPNNSIPLQFVRGTADGLKITALVHADFMTYPFKFKDCVAIARALPQGINALALSPSQKPAVMEWILRQIQAQIIPGYSGINNLAQPGHPLRSALAKPPFSGVVDMNQFNALVKDAPTNKLHEKTFTLPSDDTLMMIQWVDLVLRSNGSQAILSFH